MSNDKSFRSLEGSVINVTEPFLPPLADFNDYLKRIWDAKWLTNNGQFHVELERRLAEYLGVPYVSLFSNGTIALVTAMQALRLTGEVITTPYSFVATAHSLLWNNLTPVFCDIDPDNFSIDPEKIESLITPRTTAILPVHCYGYACDIERIKDIADRYGLKVIYDAAHAFGVNKNGLSLLNGGDLSVLSFHATKIFNTIEGGAIVSHDETMKRRIDYLKNFGFSDEVTVVAPGINGKMNEVQAAFGLLQLDNIDKIYAKRSAVDEIYRRNLVDLGAINIPRAPTDYSPNFSYFPILLKDGKQARDALHDHLRKNNIRARRYFYPLISDMPMYRGLQSANSDMLPNARIISDSVLCLPIHPNLSNIEVDYVCREIRAFFEIKMQEEARGGNVEMNPDNSRDDKDQAIKPVIGSDHVNSPLSDLPGSNDKITQISVEATQAESPVELGEDNADQGAQDTVSFSLSVVIPVYRAEKYIEQALDSIFRNHDFPIEVIAVNDGSPDQSLDVLKRYSEKEPRLVIIDQENRGGAAAINRGLDSAKNSYIMIMDCDDWLDDGGLATLSDEAVKTNADIVVGKLIKTYSDKLESAFDTNYIVRDETVGITTKSSLLQDGMYLGKLFKRELLEREGLRMDPTLLYADRPFVNVAMVQAEKIRLVAAEVLHWRQREDPSNLSATDRMHEWDNLRDRVRSIRVIRDELKSRGRHVFLKVVDEYNLKRLFWHFDRRDINSLRAFSEICRPYMRLVDLEKNKQLTNFQREVSKMIVRYSPVEFSYRYKIRSAKVFLSKYSFSKISHSLKGQVENFKRAADRALHGGRLERITRQESPDPLLVVFESFFGKSYGGQPRYIYEELCGSGRAFRAVWVYQGKQKLTGIPGNVIQVHRGTTEYFHYLARARYWVNNIRFTVNYKPPHTTYLQTWHGTPLKRLGLDIDVTGPEAQARESFLAEAANWDYLVAANRYSEDRFRSAFAFKGKCITSGYPANDLLLNPELVQSVAEEVRQELGIAPDRKVVMYAPTWRDDAKVGNQWAYRFQLRLDLARMKEEFGENSVLLLRMHHLIANQVDLAGVEDYAIDVSRYPDPTRLMAATDLLVSDYSSIFFDFVNLDRPVIFYMYDLQKYSGSLRGFYFDPASELPGPIVYTFVDLLRELRQGFDVSDSYRLKMSQFRTKYCGDETGQAAKIIVGEVFKDLPFKTGGK